MRFSPLRPSPEIIEAMKSCGMLRASTVASGAVTLVETLKGLMPSSELMQLVETACDLNDRSHETSLMVCILSSAKTLIRAEFVQPTSVSVEDWGICKDFVFVWNGAETLSWPAGFATGGRIHVLVPDWRI